MTSDPDKFIKQDCKAVTLMGMSGVGKTTLASKLAPYDWFHYSADYRIGTAYLNEPVLANLKEKAGTIPFIKDLLDSGTIRFENAVTIDNLRPISTYLGMIGNPEKEGLPREEFRRRQNQYREAEIKSMLDVPDFIEKSKKEYGARHFLNDSTGSLCELGDKNVLDTLAEHSVILYLKATEQDEKELFNRAIAYPKPLYYNDEFFSEVIEQYMKEKDIGYIALIEPDEFYTWVFPKLFNSRLPKYQKIADEYGVTITSEQLRAIETEEDFVNLIAEAMEAKNTCR